LRRFAAIVGRNGTNGITRRGCSGISRTGDTAPLDPVAVPLTAAAAVVALAISLVLVKDYPERGVVPPNPATSAGPGGVST
jgi:hypothetical protein